jgi:hypothetical protein
MRRLTSDTLKLGAVAVLLGAACLTGWVGLALVLKGGRLEPPPGFWADLSVMVLGNLILTAIVGLLAWVLTDQPAGQRRIDA